MNRNHFRSAELFARASSLVPAGVSSNTRWRAPHPLYFSRGDGAYVWDADDNRYLDILMGNGAILLGHNHPAVQESIARALKTGLTTGVEWEAMVEVAERFLAIVNTLDMVRFTNTGTEAVTHALRLARAATGRQRIAKVEGSYHGWADEMFISVWIDPAKSGPVTDIIPQPQVAGQRSSLVAETVILPFNDIENTEAALDQYGPELSALILEPTLIDIGFVPASKAYLQALRTACDRHGIVLIFDELLTGFNLAANGAQELTGVVPDLATYGKALANGYPIAALAGKEELMRRTEPGKGPAFVGTFNGHAVSIAAASACLQLYGDGSIQKTLNDRNLRLQKSFKAAAKKAGIPAQMCGGGSHFQWYFTDTPVCDYRSAATTNTEVYNAFITAVFQRGALYLANPLSHHAISLAHDDTVLEELEDIFSKSLEDAVRVLG